MFTSKLASSVPIIETDEVFRKGDSEANRLTSVKQPHGTFSKGMYLNRMTMGDVSFEEAIGYTSGILGTDGEALHGKLEINPLNSEEVRLPYVYGASLEDMPSELMIDISDLSAVTARVQEMEKAGADLHTRILMGTGGQPLNCEDQNGTYYCWCNGPTQQFRIQRLIENDDLIEFSPASLAGPLTGFRNQGGWGGAGLVRMMTNGIAPVGVYGHNQISKPSNFDAAMAIAAKYKASECWNLPNFKSVCSCLLNGFAVAVGYNWWSHEVCAIAVLIIDGAICLLCRNSWGMSYGDGKGFFILKGSKMVPDDACTLRVPSNTGRLNTAGSLATAL